jgi:hypothetical protein
VCDEFKYPIYCYVFIWLLCAVNLQWTLRLRNSSICVINLSTSFNWYELCQCVWFVCNSRWLVSIKYVFEVNGCFYAN